MVILTQVLPANSTIGYDELGYMTVTKVNGKEVKSLADLAAAVKQPVDGFTKSRPKKIPSRSSSTPRSRRRKPKISKRTTASTVVAAIGIGGVDYTGANSAVSQAHFVRSFLPRTDTDKHGHETQAAEF